MAQRADELAADITHTCEDMSGALDAVGDRLSPTQLVKRGTHRFRHGVQSAREGIMGSPSEADGAVGQGTDERADARGNPLAAGMVSFGIGLLVGSLLRPTKVEQQGLSAIADVAEPAFDAAMQAASELGHGVQESTENAAKKVGEVLTDVGQELADQTQKSASEARETIKLPNTE